MQAHELIHELTRDPRVKLPRLFARAAAWADRSGDRDGALKFYLRAYEADPAAPGIVPTMVKASALLRASGEVERSRHLLERARAHPGCTTEWTRTIDEKLATS